ncbi:MAG: hypothetical protein PSX80_00525 [bacterium]|nr:hypothetical protein [bacterium]
MKASLLTIALLIISAIPAFAQSRTNRIFRPCPSTTTPASVSISSAGAITLTPCSGQTVTIGSSSEGLISLGTFNNYIDVPSGDTFQIGAIIGGIGAALFVDRLNNSLAMSATTMDWAPNGPITWKLRRTVTTGGTTGNRTINFLNGTVNFAAAATSLTVTNSTVDTSSIILATARTNDSTCSVKNVVAGAGSFVINMTAGCTAETSVGFLVLN